MRILGFLLATLAITNVIADDSFCVKYAKQIFGKTDTTLTGTDEYNLISAVVGRVVVGCDNTVSQQYGIPTIDPTGTSLFRFYGKSNCTWPIANPPNFTGSRVAGLVNDSSNAPFFAGSAPAYGSVTNLQGLNDASGIFLAPSIRFVNLSNVNDVAANPATTGNPATNTQGLIQHLVSFFGRDLGCKFYNATFATNLTNPTFIGRYQGNGNMAAVHAKMNITKAVWTEFVTTFAQTLLSFGVTTQDVQGTVVPYVQQFLYGAINNNQICNDPSCNCAPINGQAYNNVNGTCVASGTAAPTNPAGTTTAPPTNPPTGNGTTSPPTKAAAPILGTSVATMVAMIAALLLTFL